MQEDDLHIGEYEEGEIDEIIAIEKDSFPTPWSANIFHSEITSPVSRLLVGRRVGDRKRQVVGYVVYLRVLDEMHLHNIAVRRDQRRQGIASRLLEEALRRSRVEGAQSVTLEVRQSNLPAKSFYKKLGFFVGGVRRGYYTDTGDDALIMWADIGKIPLYARKPAERGGE
jgi:ribosomal-protein-alanine N-acetyltransferase